jgi:hypothetical protein
MVALTGGWWTGATWPLEGFGKSTGTRMMRILKDNRESER